MELFTLFGKIAMKGRKEAENDIDGIINKAEGAESPILNAFKRIGLFIAGAFAVDKIKEFTMAMIETTAKIQAIDSQFQQTFKENGTQAMDLINKQADEQGIHVDRLKQGWSSFYGTFKGNGADANQSLDLTKRYMEMAADGAAYYDTSLEDVTGRLKSLVMGNFEAGDAIGVNINATKMDTKAKEQYNKKWQELSDTEKEYLLIDTVGKIYESNGAMGQGAREANNWENVTGNLKSTWERFLSVIGSPALSIASNIVKELADKIEALTEQAQNNEGIFKKFNDAIGFIKNNKDLIIGAITAITVSYAGYKTTMLVIKGVQDIINAVQLISVARIWGLNTATIAYNATQKTAGVTTKAVAAAIKLLNAAMNANPVGLVIAAITALVAIFITLWNTNDGFRNAFINAWNAVKDFFAGLPEWFSNKLEEIKNFFINNIEFIKNTVSQKWNDIKRTIMDTWNGIKSFFSDTWDGIKNIFNTVVGTIVSFVTEKYGWLFDRISAIWDGIKLYFTGAWDFIKNIFLGALLLLIDLVTGNFEELKSHAVQIWENLKSALAQMWEGIKQIFSNALGIVKDAITNAWSNIKNVTSTVWNGIKDFISELWNNLKQMAKNAFDKMREAISSIIANTKTWIINTWNSIVEWFSTLPRRLWQKGVDMFNALRNGINSIIGSVKTAIENGINNAISFLFNLPSKLKQIGKEIIQGLIDGIMSKVKAVTNAIKNVTSAITGKIKSILDIHSPSRVMKKIGGWTTEGLAIGITDKAEMVEDSINSIGKSISDFSGSLQTDFNVGYNLGGINPFSYDTDKVHNDDNTKQPINSKTIINQYITTNKDSAYEQQRQAKRQLKELGLQF